jgi:hypothetical protein
MRGSVISATIVFAAVLIPAAAFYALGDIGGAFAGFLLMIAIGFIAIQMRFRFAAWPGFLAGLLYVSLMLSAAVFIAIRAAYPP